jgi:DNA invertase Pin-like site-specific DNA recombinase
MKPLRCAVYTRKSTEDGLEQEFNSLDAQREACEAYVLSQRHEGWNLVPARYDDGGFSGGNMERPGLKALLADVDAGLVDVIVVYKVDRLTRSLADFAKIVERLDARTASFVSVTQAFNTTTSMGRLTLNVLLSFAQFEREVTGERIRDKIAASKRKGLWMGGPVPLGYQVVERKLVPEPEEAERVRYIMRCYLESFSAPRLLARLEREGVLTKVQQRVSGPHRGGIPFRRGSLFYLLKNPVYRGKIVHRGTAHDGEHVPIVDEELWDAVQARLREKAPPRKRPKNDRQNALLVGLLADPQGRPIVPTYATKGTRRYSYYETRKDLARPSDPPSSRFAQGLLDGHVLHHLGVLLEDEHGLRRLANVDEADLLRTMFEGARMLWTSLKQSGDAQAAIRSLVALIKVRGDCIEFTLKPAALGLADRPCWLWTIPLPARKPFREAKIRIDSAEPGKAVNDDLLTLIADARMALTLVQSNPELSLNQLGKREGRCRTHLARLLRIAWLSPRIVEAIVDGTQPRKLNRQTLLAGNLPIDWAEQERLLGFAS